MPPSKFVNDDIAFDILSKLPLKSLTRFSGGSKSWSLLVNDSTFMNAFRKNFLLKNNSNYNDTSNLLRYNRPWVTGNDLDPSRPWNGYNPFKSGIYSLSGEKFENMVPLDWPDLFSTIKIFGSSSINGILFMYSQEIISYILWNPATEEYKVIPPSPVSFSLRRSWCWNGAFGFGYDSDRDDYKVIQQVKILDDMTYKKKFATWEIFSVKTNTWRKLDMNMSEYYPEKYKEVYLYNDGMCHWLLSLNNDVYLVSFDMTSEIFFRTSLPANMDDNVDYRHLAVLKGSTTLISVYKETTTFHISLLREVGRNDSWIHLFTFKSLPYIGRPIGVSEDGVIFFKEKDGGELAWFNMGTEKIEKLGIRGASFCQLITYKKSLRPIEQKSGTQFYYQVTDTVDSDRKRKKTSVSAAEEESLHTKKEAKVSSSRHGGGEVRASHILIEYKGSRRIDAWNPEGSFIKPSDRYKVVALLKRMQADIVSGRATFEYIASHYSQCSCAKRNGDLGYVGQSQMPKPIEDATFALNVGEISDIVETDSGLHIIKRTE